MRSRPKNRSITRTTSRPRTRSGLQRRRFGGLRKSSRTVDAVNGGFASIPEKLEALKSIIPSRRADMKADQLFQETADYIVLLKLQVFVLQGLVDSYGPAHNRGAV
ncbi:uncharacterized protein LOC127800412 [Diospyros lotus]|uniref:uncharacterized protein LOC127800412 n=1 Tax=Diospyros lotus TaxID=55363 RepID=UPI00224CF8A0|nr:uncharacterized protein LOC127800412 [Diospyros lotus]